LELKSTTVDKSSNAINLFDILFYG
jgi:hypothetical protein